MSDDDPKSRGFWDAARESAKNVLAGPDWMRAGIVLSDAHYITCAVEIGEPLQFRAHPSTFEEADTRGLLDESEDGTSAVLTGHCVRAGISGAKQPLVTAIPLPEQRTVSTERTTGDVRLRFIPVAPKREDPGTR
jgi:hypothetical protein